MLNEYCKSQFALSKNTKSYQFPSSIDKTAHVVSTLVEKVLILYHVVKLLLKFKTQPVHLQCKLCNINEKHDHVEFRRLGAHFKSQSLLSEVKS